MTGARWSISRDQEGVCEADDVDAFLRDRIRGRINGQGNRRASCREPEREQSAAGRGVLRPDCGHVGGERGEGRDALGIPRSPPPSSPSRLMDLLFELSIHPVGAVEETVAQIVVDPGLRSFTFTGLEQGSRYIGQSLSGSIDSCFPSFVLLQSKWSRRTPTGALRTWTLARCTPSVGFGFPPLPLCPTCRPMARVPESVRGIGRGPGRPHPHPPPAPPAGAGGGRGGGLGDPPRGRRPRLPVPGPAPIPHLLSIRILQKNAGAPFSSSSWRRRRGRSKSSSRAAATARPASRV